MAQDDTKTGQLHIFFGAAPGVGKTWAMVDAGHEQHAEGLDVVIGMVDTHDRPEFASLLTGMEVIPTQEIEYEGVKLRELNVDAILQRHPDIVLIDELAHSNVPGSRHARRYQDVIDLLQAGITVLTTLNVQHVSSVADAVAEFTGIHVREQVPDFVLEMATSIQLIDLAPDELLKRLTRRLHDGPAQQADDDLFKPNTLVTLRELALRVAAARVDDDARKMATAHPVDPWGTSSRVMIGISASPANERLIRATHKLVKELRTTWLAVYVQTPMDAKLDAPARERIQDHLALAKELGAETLTVAGQHVAVRLVEMAGEYGVSRIVVGRSKKRGTFGRAKSMADEIMDLSETIDVIILS